MNAARGFERRLERFVDGLASRLFRGRIQPAEIAATLLHQADLALQEEVAGPTAPNMFAVRLHPGEIADEEGADQLAIELADIVEEAARHRGWRLEGRVEVLIREDEAAAAGAVDCVAGFRPGVLEVWAYLHRPNGRLALRPNRVLIGRGRRCDVKLEEPSVSRRHAVLWREGTGTWLADLGSSNGTFLNGQRIEEAVDVHDGDVVGAGPVSFTFSVT